MEVCPWISPSYLPSCGRRAWICYYAIISANEHARYVRVRWKPGWKHTLVKMGPTTPHTTPRCYILQFKGPALLATSESQVKIPMAGHVTSIHRYRRNNNIISCNIWVTAKLIFRFSTFSTFLLVLSLAIDKRDDYSRTTPRPEPLLIWPTKPIPRILAQ